MNVDCGNISNLRKEKVNSHSFPFMILSKGILNLSKLISYSLMNSHPKSPDKKSPVDFESFFMGKSSKENSSFSDAPNQLISRWQMV